MVHQLCHSCYNRAMVREPPAGRRVWRHGRDRYHTYRTLLRDGHPNERGLQQLPMDHHHPRRRRAGAGQSGQLLGSTDDDSGGHHAAGAGLESLRCDLRLLRPYRRRRHLHQPHRRCADHPASGPGGRTGNGRAASEPAGYGFGVDGERGDGLAYEWVPEHDGDYDGGSADGAEVFAGQALLDEGGAELDHGVWGRG